MIDVTQFVPSLLAKSANGRFVLGIAGAPGSGKSTLAQALFHELEQARPGGAVVVPMDGFHLDNETLDKLNLLSLKGIPESFDALGFVNLLVKIKQANCSADAKLVLAPRFDRSTESSIQDAIAILPSHSLILVEGNYLLLEEEPWNQIQPLCNAVWYLDVPESVLLPRLIERHKAGGKDHAGALEKVNSTDLPNGRLVAASRYRADKILTQA